MAGAWIFTLLPLLWAAGSLGGCQSGSDRAGSPSALDLRGEALLREGHLEEARVVFGQGTANPYSAFWSHLGLARCSLAKNDPGGFDQAIQAAVRLAPPSIAGVDALGRTFLMAAQSETGSRRIHHAQFAGYFFGQARRLEPSAPELGYHAGLAQHLSGHPTEALKLLEIARLEQGESPHLLLAYARVLRELRRPADIVRLLEPLEARGELPLDLIPELERARATSAPVVSRPGEPPPTQP